MTIGTTGTVTVTLVSGKAFFLQVHQEQAPCAECKYNPFQTKIKYFKSYLQQFRLVSTDFDEVSLRRCQRKRSAVMSS